MAFAVNDNTTWRIAKAVHVNDGGVWRTAKGISHRSSGTYRQAWMRNSAMAAVANSGVFYGASPGSFGTIDTPIDLRGYTLSSFYYQSNTDVTQFALRAADGSFAGWTNASYAKDLYLVGGTPQLLTAATFTNFGNGSGGAGFTVARFDWAGDVFSLQAAAGTTVYVQARWL
jgi:hypothetical protein